VGKERKSLFLEAEKKEVQHQRGGEVVKREEFRLFSLRPLKK